jgi:hypothetical protein
MFSLRLLFAVLTVWAVYVAGMVYANPWLEAVIHACTFVIYAGAITAAILSRERRAFYVAFAIFGIAYGFCLENRAGIGMVTHDMLTALAEQVHGASRYYDTRPFVTIGHALIGLCISLSTGLITEAVVKRRSNPPGVQ